MKKRFSILLAVIFVFSSCSAALAATSVSVSKSYYFSDYSYRDYYKDKDYKDKDYKDVAEKSIFIRYSIGKNGQITANYPNNATLYVQPNTKIYLYRDNSYGSGSKISISNSKVLRSYGSGVYKAIASGTSKITIYNNNWGKAFSLNVVVKGRDYTNYYPDKNVSTSHVYKVGTVNGVAIYVPEEELYKYLNK